MNKLVVGGAGFFLGAIVTSALFVGLPDNALEPVGPAPQVQPLTAIEQAEEDRFLSIDLGDEDMPKADASKNDRNEPYASCEKSPERMAWLGKRGNATYAARRDMNFYLTTTNVLATKDCTCTGKLVSLPALMAFEARLLEETGMSKVEELVTRPLHDEARTMRWQVEELCGGPI